MSQTEKFRRQHDELGRMVGNIAAVLDPVALGKDASGCARDLGKLSALLLVHLTMEDASLYPRLEKHPSEEVRNMAQEYRSTMGGLKSAFEAFMKKWPTAAEIQKNPASFIEETKGIAQALGNRIEKENNGLYALVDKMEIQLHVA